jgi:hypothetical protein
MPRSPVLQHEHRHVRAVWAAPGFLDRRDAAPHRGGSDRLFCVGTKTIRPSFAIYRRALARLGNINRSLVSDGDTLIAWLSRDTL